MREAGGVFSGRISDRIVIKWRQRRGGIWVPEDRLRASLLGGGIFLPLSVLLSGITIRYIGGVTGISLNLILLFFNGVGVRDLKPKLNHYSLTIKLDHVRSNHCGSLFRRHSPCKERRGLCGEQVSIMCPGLNIPNLNLFEC